MNGQGPTFNFRVIGARLCVSYILLLFTIVFLFIVGTPTRKLITF